MNLLSQYCSSGCCCLLQHELPSQWPSSQQTQQRTRETKHCLCLPKAPVGSPETIKGSHGSTRDLLGDYAKLLSFTGLQVCLSNSTMVHPLCKTIEICWWIVPWEKREGSGEGFLGCRHSAQVRLFDMPFLCIFDQFFISGPQHKWLVKCPNKEHIPCGWGRRANNLYWSHQKTRARASRAKRGPLETSTWEWRPTAQKERRIVAIVDLLAKALSFFDGLYALEFYVHNISPLNRIQVFINTSQDLQWSS